MTPRALGTGALVLAAALACAAPVTVLPRAAAAGEPDAPLPFLESVGPAYEAARQLPADQRPAALDQVELSLARAVRGDLDDSRRKAARFLAGRLLFDRGDFAAAREAFESARGGPRRDLEDDLAFAAIEALEAGGDDARAAREWERWESRHADSPLLPYAQLAMTWNALRRGEIEAAGKKIAAIARQHPWMLEYPPFALARATASHAAGQDDDALAVLKARPADAASAYLRALCLERKGSLLQAAAAFQEAAERDRGSSFRDHALFAKANTFLMAGDHRSAAQEFERVAGLVDDAQVRAECELRRAGATFLSGHTDSALALLRPLTDRHRGGDVAARAQFLVGECLVEQGLHAEAIVELNRVLTDYFQHSVAASAQYRVARCLDAMGRPDDATGSYQAVVTGYPLAPEAPASAYLAGCGLLRQGKPLAAAPYFQLVLDRYAGQRDTQGMVVFARPEHQELVEAALCLLELSYHRAGNLGMLSGAPHLLLSRMPPSRSPWRAWALLIDADASASQARHPEAQATLETLAREFPDHPLNAQAMRLLAWTHSRQGRDSLAIATEERLLARWAGNASEEVLSAAFLDIAHERFNQKRYAEAAGAYEDFLRRHPGHARRVHVLYQLGLCYLRLDRAGDAVDRWETLLRDAPSAPLAERAWARAGDVYFQAERYEDARRCYRGLLEHFAGTGAASLASLRLAQCAYNAGDDADALEAFSRTAADYPGTPAAREAVRGQERALYRLSQSPDGTRVLARLVDQYPNSAFAADAQFQIARRAYDARDFAAAAEGFRRVVSQFPGYSAADHAQFLLSDALAQAGDAAAARQALDQFLAYFPASELAPMVHFRLGLARFEAGDYMAAAVAFTRTLQDTAGRDVTTAARYNLALCHRQLGQTGDARTALERYRAEFPGDERAAEVAYQLGDLAEAQGRVEDAAREFAAALAAKPSRERAVELAYRLGRAREQAGDPEGALKAYARAMEAQDRDQAFRLSAVARMAALHEARKEYAKAMAAYRDIMRHAKDPELVAVANDRVSELEALTRRR